MYEVPSRKKKICVRAMTKAKRGEWSLDNELVYKSEIKKLEAQLGVKVIPKGELTKGLNPVSISWRDAFKNKKQTLEQSEYISGWDESVPECEKFAEELAMRTLRALAKLQKK